MKDSTKKKLGRGWRKFVLFSGESCPVHDPAWSMGISVLMFLIAFIFFMTGMSLERLVSGFPLFLRILQNTPGVAIGLKVLSFAIVALAAWQCWRHQARCLIDCYPKYFDPYNT